VRLYNDTPTWRNPLAQIAQNGLDTLGVDAIEYLSKHVYSVMVRTGITYGFGTAVPVAPGTWLTCKHVIEPYAEHKMAIPSTNMHDHAAWGGGIAVTRLPVDPADQTYIDNLVKNDTEPLYGLPADNADLREYFDLVLLSGPTVDVVYPSTEVLHIGDKVAVFGYNGVPSPDTINLHFDKLYGSSPLKPTYSEASNIFHVIGSKGASFGSIRAIGPEGVLTHDCSTLPGASGSILVKVVNGSKQFVGIHTGGSFKAENSDPFNFGYCASHTNFVLFYAKILYPIFKQHGQIPAPVVAYLKQHRAVLGQHHDFLANDIFTIL